MATIKLSFRQRPIPIPAEYRPIYKIGLIVLILKICGHAEKASLLKLHLLSWATLSKGNMQGLEGYVKSGYQDDFSVWGIEPALNRALQYAGAERICGMDSDGNYILLEKGQRFYQMISADPDLFATEKAFFAFLGKKKITDNHLLKLSKRWNVSHAKN